MTDHSKKDPPGYGSSTQDQPMLILTFISYLENNPRKFSGDNQQDASMQLKNYEQIGT